MAKSADDMRFANAGLIQRTTPNNARSSVGVTMSCDTERIQYNVATPNMTPDPTLNTPFVTKKSWKEFMTLSPSTKLVNNNVAIHDRVGKQLPNTRESFALRRSTTSMQPCKIETRMA